MSNGYLYVLTHPDKEGTYKVGRTTRDPLKRLAEHNSNLNQACGKIVEVTGKNWELAKYYAVADQKFAERFFWDSTGLGELPGGIGTEILNSTSFEYVERLILAAQQAAAKHVENKEPKAPSKPKKVVRNREWFLQKLEGTGLKMLSSYRGLATGVEFECANGHMFKRVPGYMANHLFCPICREQGIS